MLFRSGWITRRVEDGRNGLYVLFMNRLYADELYQHIGRTVMRTLHRVDKRERGWSR